MLQAMNTGHEGSLSTCHANTPDDALRRLETMVLMAEVGLPLAAVREQLAAVARPRGARRPVRRRPAPGGRRWPRSCRRPVPARSAPSCWPTARRWSPSRPAHPGSGPPLRLGAWIGRRGHRSTRRNGRGGGRVTGIVAAALVAALLPPVLEVRCGPPGATGAGHRAQRLVVGAAAANRRVTGARLGSGTTPPAGCRPPLRGRHARRARPRARPRSGPVRRPSTRSAQPPRWRTRRCGPTSPRWCSGSSGARRSRPRSTSGAGGVRWRRSSSPRSRSALGARFGGRQARGRRRRRRHAARTRERSATGGAGPVRPGPGVGVGHERHPVRLRRGGRRARSARASCWSRARSAGPCLAAGITLNGAGAFWMARITGASS